MAANNNFDSNFTRRLARVFLKQFEMKRVLSKAVDTQLLAGKFNPASGTIVDFKRPTDYVAVRTAKGDISSEVASPIITGKASGIVQEMFTVFVDFSEFDQSLKMDQLEQLLEPMSTRIVTDLELDFAEFMMKNAGLSSGVPGEPVDAWSDISNAGAVMKSSGIPKDGAWNYALNPFVQTKLADLQSSLASGGTSGALVKSAWEEAMISANLGGMRVFTATSLGTYTTGGGADRVGAINGTIDTTYLTHKDSMIQSLIVDGFTSGLVVKAGEKLKVAGIFQLNLSTRKPMIDASGAQVLWEPTVTEDVTLAGGAGTIKVTGPAIFESAAGSGKAFNTVDKTIADNTFVTLSETSSSATLIQPNLFWHKQAFGIGFTDLQKLFSTDTLATTKDGIRMRISKGTNFLENEQLIRIDIRPAYAVLNPFFAGQGYGLA